jgi:hypothetical protein
MKILLALAALASAGHQPRTASGDLVDKTYELATVMPDLHSSAYVENLAPYLWPTEFSERIPALDEYSTTDSVADVVVQVFSAELEYEGRKIEYSDGRLRVVAPPALHKEIERTLAFLESAMRRSVELRIDVFNRPLEAAPLATLLSTKDADDLVAAAGASARTYVLRVTPGRIATLDLTREVPLVGDYDVEIAQTAVQVDPVMFQFMIGTRLAARAAIVPGGVKLALVCRDGSQVGELHETRMELGGIMVNDSGRTMMTQPVTLQSVSVLQRSLALNLALPEGKVAVIESTLAVQTGTSRVAMLLRASAERREPFNSLVVGNDRARLEVLDASYLCPPRATISGQLFQHGTFPRSMSALFAISSSRGGEPAANAMPSLAEQGWVESEIDSSGAYHTIALAPWILAYALKDGADSKLAPSAFGPDSAILAQARTPENALMHLTLRRANGSVAAQAWLPMVYGEESAAIFGGESLFVSDADVEVATGAATIDPVIQDAFDGLAISARPLRANDGGSVIELCARAHVLTGTPQQIAVGAPLSLPCERREFDELIADERLVFAAQGGARRVSLGGGALTLELELR